MASLTVQLPLLSRLVTVFYTTVAGEAELWLRGAVERASRDSRSGYYVGIDYRL